MLSPAPAKTITASFIAEIEMGCFRVGLINVMIVCKVDKEREIVFFFYDGFFCDLLPVIQNFQYII